MNRLHQFERIKTQRTRIDRSLSIRNNISVFGDSAKWVVLCRNQVGTSHGQVVIRPFIAHILARKVFYCLL